MPVNRITASNTFHKSSSRKVSFSSTPQKNTTNSQSQAKNGKMPYIAAGIAIAALAGAVVFRNQLGFGASAQKIPHSLNNPQRLQKIQDIKSRCEKEFKKILDDNTIFGEIKLDKMDEAARFRALDKARPDYLHEAANMAEEAYKTAYQKAIPQEGKNILDRISFRIVNESKTLPEIYAQLPREEALERINVFTKSAYALDSKSGMQPKTLFNTIVEYMEQVKK